MNTKKIFSNTLVLSLIILSFNISANTELVTVKIIEEGSSKEIAINNALMRAVSQVNGFELNAKIDSDFYYNEDGSNKPNNRQIDYYYSANKTQSNNPNDSESVLKQLASTAISEYTQKGLTKKSDYKTKGLVKSWKIISESYSSLSGKWTVEVEVTIEKIVEFKLSKETERVRIAISPFRTVDQKFSRFFEESLNSYLAQSRKFAMFDRKYTQEQSSELAKYRNSNFRKGEVSRIGNMLGVDYIVVGDVAEFKEQTNNSIKLKTINAPFKKKKIFIDISFRVIDVATGQVNYSGYLAEAFLKDKNYSIINLSRKVAGLIGNKIINSIYPITVMQVDGDRVVLAQGGDTLSVGDKFNLIQYGKELFDPYTNESLGYSENRIGVIEVLDVQNKLSTARIVSLNVQKLNTSSRMIVRPVLKKKEATTSSTIRNINLPKVKVKDIDKDGDW